MDRVLVIDQDRAAMQQFGLACLAKGVGVATAETLSEGVRTLLSTPVSLIVVDAAQLRLTAGEHARLFERVAPAVPVTVVVSPDAPLEARVAYEVAGFRVLNRTAAVGDLVDEAIVPATDLGG